MRVALLSYRSLPHGGGQGVYVRHLSRALARAGHTVEVFSGQPYPVLDDLPGGEAPDARALPEGSGSITLTPVPSLDLYREPDPFRTPRRGELRDLVDVEEVLTMRAGGFPEPRTFSLRVARMLAERADEFDVVHDNQTLGAGLLDVERVLPVVTTVHHPITVDRRVEIAAAPRLREGSLRRLSLRRWYGFLGMQARVARASRVLVCPSEAAAADVVREFGVDPARVRVVPLGVEEHFVPPAQPRVPGRIVALASADAPMKGVATLLRAVAGLRESGREVELVLVCRPRPGGPTERLVAELDLGDSVRFVHGLDVEDLVALMGSAEVGCVPSLYEGFSLPTAELMACATPLVVSAAGAIPEVVGPDGLCADQVPPGDEAALEKALARLLDDPDRRARYGTAARERARSLFTWEAVAERTAAVHAETVAAWHAAPPRPGRRSRALVPTRLTAAPAAPPLGPPGTGGVPSDPLPAPLQEDLRADR
ncbi:glycosyltransferase family 4 protein [Nocardioides bruguierae]|uniref:glycosyltransferase family 4 protein n=1 Tax=Nocardioides bruguierae TaxID=2945102 RepID=UPI0020203BC5|nr:glycosyltransferase family 4 protein [Nocardioides bruguierae]MCL8024398.1 glycosyltransferase family 4 protein [Nocardioides bruguierae]